MEESSEASRNARNEDQFLTIGRHRPDEVAVLCLDCQTTEVEQMMQLPAIGPTQGHFASVFSKHFAIGPNFGVSPEIAANLVEVVEVGSENLTRIVTPGLRMSAGKPWQSDVRVDQPVETRVEQVKGQSAGRLQMAANGLQRFSL